MSVKAIFPQLQVLSNFRSADDPRPSGNHLIASHLVDARLQNAERTGFDAVQRERGQKVDVRKRKITSAK
ncbi:MAG: hypothetical protein DMG41_02045 [Acidobacteria bacterium]|nr:MAG: hypothetical protein DMG41_02045 [Acidobacteriota bacterium]PYU67230.1 MAG: hypothetical protein DMG52_34590 [Acidobacteriota bacterium]